MVNRLAPPSRLCHCTRCKRRGELALSHKCTVSKKQIVAVLPCPICRVDAGICDDPEHLAEWRIRRYREFLDRTIRIPGSPAVRKWVRHV
jgi:transcription elongation factor Elf1